MERSARPYAKSNPALDKALQECRDPNQIQQILAAHGMTSRHGSGVYDVIPDAERQQQAPSVSLPAVSGDSTSTRYSRIIYVINNRFEIFSDSPAGLDSQEAALRAMYGKQ